MRARVSDHAGSDRRSRYRAGPCGLPLKQRRRHPGVKTFAAQWLARTIPCRRFDGTLTDAAARLGADVVR